MARAVTNQANKAIYSALCLFQIQPRTFSLTKYGTWCGQKMVLRDGAATREFCSQLYDPFIMPCWDTYRTLYLSFRNDDLSILTHFNISIWGRYPGTVSWMCVCVCVCVWGGNLKAGLCSG